MTDEAKQGRDARHDARRRALKPWRNWYKLRRWLDLREGQLTRQPLCERCLKDFRVRRATVAHHLIKHEGDAALFWDPDNLASSCKPCHDRHEQAQEARGYALDLAPSGWPSDPNHPANRTPDTKVKAQR